jgi:hypothetical protein
METFHLPLALALLDPLHPLTWAQGFINNPTSLMAPTVTWDAGSTINVTLTGTATHNGGSCQFALSYDNGTTWSTIYSYVGGCMIDTLNYDMQLPSESPSGTAIFAWMWENHSGNREMYMVSRPGLGALTLRRAGLTTCRTVRSLILPTAGPVSTVLTTLTPTA